MCVVDGVLLALGGSNDSESKLNNAGTSAIYAFDPTDQKWQRVGEMPFECSSVNTLLLSEERLLVIDGRSLRVLVVTVKGMPSWYYALCTIITIPSLGLATVFPNASNFMTADDRYVDNVVRTQDVHAFTRFFAPLSPTWLIQMDHIATYKSYLLSC